MAVNHLIPVNLEDTVRHIFRADVVVYGSIKISQGVKSCVNAEKETISTRQNRRLLQSTSREEVSYQQDVIH